MNTPVTRIDTNTRDGDYALEQLATILSAAFADDPGMQVICQHERRGYTERLRHWFLATLRMYRANQQPLLTVGPEHDLVACAILTAPDANLKPMTLLRWLWETTWQAGLKSVWRTMAHMRHIEPYQPSAPHYCLEFLAVHPAHQGQGYGSLLLEETHRLAEADERTIGVWLETANPDLVPLYERFGYAVENQLRMDSQIDAVMMFRKNH